MNEQLKNPRKGPESPRDIGQINKKPLTEWEQVQLFETLRKGPGANPRSWDHATLNDLVRLVDHHQSVLWWLVSDPFAMSEDWDENEDNSFSKLVDETYDSGEAFEASRSDEDLKLFANALHHTLAAQALPSRSEDEVLEDYLNAGRVLRSEGDCSWIQDAHGREFLMPNVFLPDSLSVPPEMVDKEEGRRFEQDHCVCLKTNKYEGKGLPQGAAGYVLQLVSNNSFEHLPNYCQVIFVTAYDAEQQSYEEDYLEVRDNDLELCDKDHRPPVWFPFEVKRDGFIKKTISGKFKRRSRAKSYTYDELFDILMGERQAIEGQGPSGSSSSPEEAPEQGKPSLMTGLKNKLSKMGKKTGRRLRGQPGKIG